MMQFKRNEQLNATYMYDKYIAQAIINTKALISSMKTFTRHIHKCRKSGSQLETPQRNSNWKYKAPVVSQVFAHYNHGDKWYSDTC